MCVRGRKASIPSGTSAWHSVSTFFSLLIRAVALPMSFWSNSKSRKLHSRAQNPGASIIWFSTLGPSTFVDSRTKTLLSTAMASITAMPRPLPALPRSHDLHPTRSPNIPHTNRPKRHHVPLQTPPVPQPLPLTIDHAPPSSKAKLSPLATSSATSSDASPTGTSSCPAASPLSRPYSPLTGRERWGHRAAHEGVGTEECCGGGAGAGAGIEQVREIGGESGVVRFGSRRDRSGRMRT
jgi:hypothetical protein